MHLTCHPTVWDQAHGLHPVDIKELQIQASPEELRALAGFLADSAARLEATTDSEPQRTFEDTRPAARKTIAIRVNGATEGP